MIHCVDMLSLIKHVAFIIHPDIIYVIYRLYCEVVHDRISMLYDRNSIKCIEVNNMMGPMNKGCPICLTKMIHYKGIYIAYCGRYNKYDMIIRYCFDCFGRVFNIGHKTIEYTIEYTIKYEI